MKKIWIVFIIFIILFSLLSCFKFSQKITIKNGFNDDMISMLKDQYKLKITSDTKFISGYYWDAIQDSSINITFKVPQNQFNSLFISNWEECTSTNWDLSDANKYISSKEFKGLMYTEVFYSSPQNGFIEINFIGRYPQYRIK